MSHNHVSQDKSATLNDDFTGKAKELSELSDLHDMLQQQVDTMLAS